mgnify:CR=1 FL=1
MPGHGPAGDIGNGIAPTRSNFMDGVKLSFWQLHGSSCSDASTADLSEAFFVCGIERKNGANPGRAGTALCRKGKCKCPTNHMECNGRCVVS